MDGINVWWNGLDAILKVLYCIAIPATLLMIIQTVLSLSGFGGGTDINISDTSGLDFAATDIEIAEVGSDVPVTTDFGGLKFLTVQGFIIFFTIFSWTAIAFTAMGLPPAAGIAIGILAGAAAMYGAAVLIRFLRSLAYNGTVNMRNAIGETAEVYMPVPAKGGGVGKVTLNIQGRFMECDAVTNGLEQLKTGSGVKVTDLQGNTLVVEAI
jgi:membrane protein implicated in regulation of membrane protease activity